MPKLSLDVVRPYAYAVASVGLVVVSRLALRPLLGDHDPFSLFFLVIVLAAGYGGYGPSLLAVVLSWLSVDYFFLRSACQPGSLRIQDPSSLSAFFSVGLAITLLGGFLRAARERALVRGLELRRAFRPSRRSGNGSRSPWPASPTP